jgi:hypothetical protein
VYNRYIGNTGRYIRVEDSPPQRGPGPVRRPGPPNIPGPGNVRGGPPAHQSPPVSRNIKKSPQFGPLGGLKGLLGGLGGSGGGGLGLGGGLKNMLGHLPFGLDVGDLLLLGLLLLFFVDSHDEEFLIILAFFAYSIYKDSKGVPLDTF